MTQTQAVPSSSLSSPLWITRARRLRWALAALLALIALLLPFGLQPYNVLRLTLVLIFGISIMGLNLLTGYAGQISLGHGAFFAVGAYVTAITCNEWSSPFAVALPASLVVTFVLGGLIGIPALRIRGVYLGVITLALAIIVPSLVKRFDSVTGGAQGLRVPQLQAPAWSGLGGDQWTYFVVLVVCVLVFLGARNLTHGHIGRAMVAVRENELAASANGVDVVQVKLVSFAVSAALAGLAGGLYAIVVGYVAPDSFTLLLSINLLAGMVVGGAGSIAGPLIGAVFIEYTPIVTSGFNQALGGMIYGLVIVVVMLLFPKGVVGLGELVAARLPWTRPDQGVRR
ncbi:branched-chain amino acid ABC transporter permease [Acrocarpospora pleiomorpha]|uniref:Branched-chain amino acid ABC transporter permease n=1 Tax=Acrocarpospora pleiomorpha TaxID=90975 RepID=A0A5M3XLE6_9ACTN|nr:branched-chain amino acid ABC transporter permease [Acrocarpospora pleiomorpha]GES21556.1 branched-chain amino acid ABC transporter permease [Acrocarpospora pleiomorpha]